MPYPAFSIHSTPGSLSCKVCEFHFTYSDSVRLICLLFISIAHLLLCCWFGIIFICFVCYNVNKLIWILTYLLIWLSIELHVIQKTLHLPPFSHSGLPEPSTKLMQFHTYQLSSAVCLCRLTQGFCLYCSGGATSFWHVPFNPLVLQWVMLILLMLATHLYYVLLNLLPQISGPPKHNQPHLDPEGEWMEDHFCYPTSHYESGHAVCTINGYTMLHFVLSSSSRY